MELQFQKISIPCLHRLVRQVQNQEQTQEVKLTDGMPDIGRVLGAWGQVMIRGKEWREDTMSVSCGCMVWVLYTPEDGSPAQSLETWIPFNLKWEMPETERDGVFSVQCLLRSVDARATSSRKLMVRASVGILAEAFAREQAELSVPGEVPDDVQLKKTVWPVRMAREAGEKPFVIDEDLTMPQSCEPLEKLIRYELLPEMAEQKVMSDKVVFRGTALLHILYRGQSGQLHSWDFEIPFSQYAELEQSYGHDATAKLLPAMTSLELDAQEGRLRLKAGLTGQYVIYDREELQIVEDAYSVVRPVTVKQEQLTLPTMLEEQQQMASAGGVINQAASRVADTVFYPDHPRARRQGAEVSAELPGLFQVLYYDEEGALQVSTVRWEGNVSLPAAEDVSVDVACCPTGMPVADASADTINARGMATVSVLTTAGEAIPMVSGLLLGDAAEPDPSRPSLILRRAAGDSLWDIAKQTGSTVDAICRANDLQAEPAPDKMLLIPIA